MVYFTKDAILYWSHHKNKDEPWARSTAPFHGWHHLAMVYDGKHAQTYLDCQPLAAVEGFAPLKLIVMGNSGDPQHEHWMNANGIDEQLIFSRPLTVDELKTVMNFTKPKGK